MKYNQTITFNLTKIYQKASKFSFKISPSYVIVDVITCNFNEITLITHTMQANIASYNTSIFLKMQYSWLTH